jgi:putative SOS response-associated peptidase YedK
MCGRFGLSRPDRLDLKRFGVTSLPETPPRFNIAPGSDVLVVRQRSGERRADLLHWGLIPSWAHDASIGDRMANARADTAYEKAAFRSPIRLRRCLIPADVFYEWQVVPGQRRKQPHAVTLKGGEPFALGGIWDYWRPKEGGEGIASCTVLTTEPNALLAEIHDRMPVIVPPAKYRAWLDPHTPVPAVKDMMQPHDSEGMETWAVSLRVNDAREDDARLLEPGGSRAVGGEG